MNNCKIGIRYCGGCNPRYDRTHLVEKIKSMLPDNEFTYTLEGSDLSCCLLVCGCTAACVNVADLQGTPLIYATNLVTAEEIVEQIKKQEI